MGDVSEILGVKKARKSDALPGSALSASSSSSSSKKRASIKALKPPNVSREVYALMGFNGINGRDGSGTPGAYRTPECLARSAVGRSVLLFVPF